MEQFDIIIIGAGRAMKLAKKAAKKNKKVALIEKYKLGGTCPINGCVPSKLFVGYAQAIRAIQESSNHFITSKIEFIDITKMIKETNDYIESIDPKHEKELHENITLFRGEGKFISNYIVTINDNVITAPIIVIATGSRSRPAPIDNAWTTEDIFPFYNKIPNSIAIVGGGFIACELVNFFDAVGIKTKLIVRGDELLPNEDSDIKKVFKEQYSKIIDIEFNTEPKDIVYEDKMFKMNLVNKDGNKKEYECEAMLYAIGRIPNSDNLGLENTSIKLDKKGFIKRDRFMQTNVEGVYVIGDVAGENMLQHTASKEAVKLGNILFENDKTPLNLGLIPHAVYSNPEIASIGYTEEKAKEEKLNFIAITKDWSGSAKVMSMRIDYPLTKLIVNPKTYEILGCHLIGPQSSTAIHQVMQLIHQKNDIKELKNLMYIHPALSEVLLEASIECLKIIKSDPSRL